MNKVIERGFVSQLSEEPSMGEQFNIFYSVTGYFIMQKDKPTSLRLFDANARMFHELDNVSFLWRVSSEQEGEKKFPRPFVYKEFSEKNFTHKGLISNGEILKLSYMNGSIYDPLVEGAIESYAITAQKKFLHLDIENLDRQPKRYYNDAYTFEQEFDGKGNLNIKLVSTDPANGAINLQVSGNVNLQQIDKDGNVTQSMVMDDTKDAENITVTDKNLNIIKMSKAGVKVQGQKDKKSEFMVYGETIKKKIEDLIDAIGSIIVMTPAGTSSPVSSLPNNKTALATIKDSLTEILTQ